MTQINADTLEDEFMDEEARLSARMDQGLYSLQQCALIIGHLWFVGDLGVRKRILQLLHQKVLRAFSEQERIRFGFGFITK